MFEEPNAGISLIQSKYRVVAAKRIIRLPMQLKIIFTVRITPIISMLPAVAKQPSMVT